MRFRFLEAIPASVVTVLALSINTTFSQNAEPQIEEISVIGQFVPDEKRGTDQVSNVVGQEQFTRSGDANIAESLKRISGLSTVGALLHPETARQSKALFACSNSLTGSDSSDGKRA